MKKLLYLMIAILTIMTLTAGALASPVKILSQDETPDFAEDAELLKVYVFDIFARDCILVQCGGKNMLIDCGSTGYGTRYIWPGLQKLGVDHIDVAINTHPDEDHIGGFFTLIDLVPIDVFYTCYPADYCKMQSQFLALAEQKGLPVEWVTEDTDLSFGGASIWTFQDWTLPQKANPCSLIMHLTFGDSKILFLADTTYEVQNKMAFAKGEAAQADVVKIAHHGVNAPTEKFMDIVQPQVGVITHWRHEITKVSAYRLDQYNCSTFYSGEGMVELVTDGSVWTVRQFRK